MLVVPGMRYACDDDYALTGAHKPISESDGAGAAHHLVEIVRVFGHHAPHHGELAPRREETALRSGHQRASGTGALAAGFCCTVEGGGWVRTVAMDGGVNAIFCLMSSSIARNAITY